LRQVYGSIKIGKARHEAVLTNTTRKFKKTFIGLCNNCGQQGHKAADCWKKDGQNRGKPATLPNS
jgi:hypothetical protein